FAYIGFDAVSTVAEETRNPARNMPIGIIGSLVISTIIYIVVAAVFTGIVPYNVLRQKLATEQAEPLTMALQYANIQKWGNLFVGTVGFGSLFAHTAVLLVFQLGQPRIFSRWPGMDYFHDPSRRCTLDSAHRTSPRF